MSSHCWLHPERFYSPFERLVNNADFYFYWKINVNFEKNDESSTNVLMARQERDFSPLERVFPIWVRGERSLRATLAPKMRSPLFGMFERDVSAKRARRERDQIAFECDMSAKISLCYSSILPVNSFNQMGESTCRFWNPIEIPPLPSQFGLVELCTDKNSNRPDCQRKPLGLPPEEILLSDFSQTQKPYCYCPSWVAYSTVLENALVLSLSTTQ